MSQTFFVWPHGGKSVSVASDFNHWTPQPLVKQGNYFFTVLDIPDGTYEYKFVVDGRWVYDISQPHQDDGSGNWNNYVEVGKAAQHHAPAAAAHSSAPAKHEQKGKQQQQHQQQKKEQQPKKEKEHQPQQKDKEQQKEKEHQPQQQPQESKRKQKGKQQQQPAKAAEPEPEPQPEPEPEPQNEEVAEEETPAPAPAQEEKKEKVLISIITLEVVGSDVDTDMDAVEKFVRGIQRPGLKWEGSVVKEHVFGLKKLEIICQARDDVAVEDDVCVAISANEDLIGGATILNFSC
jgi:translation elongation factor EF-1beta